jgi:hypothetical protein
VVHLVTKHRIHESPAAPSLADEVARQPIRAAVESGDWTRFVGEAERAHALSLIDGDIDSGISEFDSMLLGYSGREPAAHPPSSSRTAIGPLGVTTERKLRTLDPREPSIERTRLDLFSSVGAGAPGAPGAVGSGGESRGDAVPPSYRTKIGLYFVPRDPATEPSLPLADLGFDDETTDVRGRDPRRALRTVGLLSRARSWLRAIFARLSGRGARAR